MPRNATTGVYARVVNSFSDPVFGTLIDPDDAAALFDDQDDTGFNPPTLGLTGDIILTHPLTPLPDNDAHTLITLGYRAGLALAPIHSTQYLTLLGAYAGSAITTADHITAIGTYALEHYTVNTSIAPISPSITAIGVDSCRALTTGEGLTAIGEHTMTTSVGPIKNSVAVGNNAMLNAAGERQTAVGYNALAGATTAVDNSAFGYGTLSAVTALAASNTAIGAFNFGALTSGTNNTGLGNTAGLSVTTGSFNLLIGNATGGVTLTTGSRNILIGNSADTPAAGTNDYLNIGGYLYGDATNFVRTKGSAGTKPASVLSGTSGTVGSDDSAIIISSSGSFTLTLPSAATYPGRWLTIKTVAANTVASATSNVVPLVGGSAGTAILAATTGKWAQLQSDGGNWNIMAGN